MNKELENKALDLIYKLRTYNPAAGDDPNEFIDTLIKDGRWEGMII